MNPFNNRIHQAMKAKELGNSAYKNRQFDAALKHYEEAIKHDPTNMSYISNKAGINTHISVKPGLQSYIFISYSAVCLQLCTLRKESLTSAESCVWRPLRLGGRTERITDQFQSKSWR